MTTYTNQFESPLGQLLMASDGEYLTGLWFLNQKHFAAKLDDETFVRELPIFDATKHWLADYFEGKHNLPTLPLKPIGTDYQKNVWQKISEIPYGQTVTYQDIANSLSTEHKTSPRAVGGAVGRNPISIIVPCHRVIGSNQQLTGYAGGIERKIALLKLEKTLLI